MTLPSNGRAGAARRVRRSGLGSGGLKQGGESGALRSGEGD